MDGKSSVCRRCVNRQTVYEEVAKRQQKCIGLVKVGVNSDVGVFVNRLECHCGPLTYTQLGREGGGGDNKLTKILFCQTSVQIPPA